MTREEPLIRLVFRAKKIEHEIWAWKSMLAWAKENQAPTAARVAETALRDLEAKLRAARGRLTFALE